MIISIIVPVYNGEKYLEKTIELILNQHYRDIELILVNDGSKDNSKEICEKYARIDNRVVLINTKNGGISSARNVGIKAARGEWISFVDQDDEISVDIYKSFVNAIDTSVDMIVSGKQMLLVDYNENVIKKQVYEYEAETVRNQNRIREFLFNVNKDTRLLHIWNCLYKKELIEKNVITFNPKLKYGHEDSLFNVEYVSKCSEIRFIRGVVYTYSRRAGSSTSLKQNNDFYEDFVTYCDVAGACVSRIDKESEGLFFTYLFRLGVNLFKQYGSKKNKDILKNIYGKSIEISNARKISRRSVASVQLYCFYNICALLLRCNCTTLSYYLIRFSPKK